MTPYSRLTSRSGAILPLVLISLVGLLGFVAFAIDLGMMVVARTQAQSAADSAAMAGARALDGDTANNNNSSNAITTAITTATQNTLLSQPIQPSEVTVELGSYGYETGPEKFVVQIPRNPSENWSLARVTINRTSPTAFARVFGANLFDTTATGTAVHRPRDIALIMDFSGSMRFDTMLAFPHSGTRTNSMNPDQVFPVFGHYSAVASAALQGTIPRQVSSGEYVGLCNLTVATTAGPVLMNDFYQHAPGTSPQTAFTAASNAYASVPGGDNYLRVNLNTGATYATTVKDVTNSTAKHNGFETNGYQAFTGAAFTGRTQGPGYWGKTFFVWPPDPKAANDWRKKFFKNPGTSVGVDDNTKLWNSSGVWKAPKVSGTNNYDINYNAILTWIKNTGPNSFPSTLRSGRIRYYTTIPNTINTSTFPPTNPDERFWKEYIDYVFGVQQTSSTNYNVVTTTSGYGDDFTWGTIKISAKPNPTTDGRYMDYLDNPRRPRLRFWFGPLSLIDFIGNYNQGRFWWPGTCHEASLYACKLGVQAALVDTQRNHPNDLMSTMYFNSPQYSSGGAGRFNQVRAPLSRNYQRMIDALWFPPSTLGGVGGEITPYSPDNNEVPRASGGTCTVMGFMLAANQFSGNPTLRNFASAPAPVGTAGGLGRRGAQKLIILETDGMANTLAAAGFTNAGPGNGFYNIRQPGEYPSNSGPAVDTQIYQVVDQICALEASGGFSTSRKPVKIHCIAFGSLFEPGNFTASTSQALTLLQTIQYKGKTQSSSSLPLAPSKIIVGSPDQRVQNLQQTFSAIMQDGVFVSLIE